MAVIKLSTDHVLRGLDDLRDRKLLCDVHLVAEGAKFPAHRVVLAAASPYFKAMFTGGFKENQMNEITLTNTSMEGLKCVLDAIYTGELSISVENICNVLPVANQLQLNEIVKHCAKFLSWNITVQNCLPFLAVAEKYDLQEAVNKCYKFVLENFDTLSQSTEFTNLSQEKLCSYLSDDKLKVRNGEIEVFRATLKWYEANQSADTGMDSSGLFNLMKHVRFPLIPGNLLLDEVQTNGLITENPEVMMMVKEALRFHSSDNIFLQPLQEGKQFQPRGDDMFALLHSTFRRTVPVVVNKTKLHTLGGITTRPFYVRFRAQQDLPMALYPGSLSLVTKGNYLFLFGCDADYFREIAVRFDVRKNTWLDLKSPPYKASIGMGATLLKGDIYLLGGMRVTKSNLKSEDAFNTVDGSKTSARASKYSIETNCWSAIEKLPKPAAFHSTASQGNYVFCAGGYCADSNSTVSTDKLYAFDVVGKLWLSKASMIHQRAEFSLEAVGAKLVACGS